jgi:hypothetical protein
MANQLYKYYKMAAPYSGDYREDPYGHAGETFIPGAVDAPEENLVSQLQAKKSSKKKSRGYLSSFNDDDNY